MARITVEDCLTKETNRFGLVRLASERTKQLLHGARSLLNERRENKAVVSALREIAEGHIRFMTEEEAAEARRKAAEEQEQQAHAAVILAPPPQPAPTVASGSGSSDDEEGAESRNGDNIF